MNELIVRRASNTTGKTNGYRFVKAVFRCATAPLIACAYSRITFMTSLSSELTDSVFSVHSIRSRIQICLNLVSLIQIFKFFRFHEFVSLRLQLTTYCVQIPLFYLSSNLDIFAVTVGGTLNQWYPGQPLVLLVYIKLYVNYAEFTRKIRPTLTFRLSPRKFIRPDFCLI